MAFCTHCGNRISDLAVECPKCGTRTPIAQTVPVSPTLQGGFPNAPQLRPLGVGEIIDAAIKVYRSNALPLLKAVALVVVPVQVLGALIQTSVIPDPVSPLQQGPLEPGTVPAPAFDASDIWTFVGGFVLTALLNWLAAQLATAASLRAVSKAYLGESADWRQSLEFAFRNFGALIWVALLSAFGVGFGYVLCIIPGIWLSISWSVAIPALLFEGERGTAALSRSFRLVKGRWWAVAGATVLGQIIASILGAVFGFGFGVLSFVNESAFVTFISTALSTAISQTLVTPFLAAMIAIIYFDLRVRKEGFDLELLAQHVGDDPPGGTFGDPGWIPGTPTPPPPAPGDEFSSVPGPSGAAPPSPASPPPPRPRPRPSRPGVGSGPPAAEPSEPTGEPAAEPPQTTDTGFRPPPRRRPVRPGHEPRPPDDDGSSAPSR